MPTTYRATPTYGSVAVPGGGTWPIAEFLLGGVPRGAVLALCDQGMLEADSPDIVHEFAMHGYETLVCDSAIQHHDTEAELDLIDALLDRLGSRGWHEEQIGIAGFGSGGRSSLLAARHFRLGAAVSVSPPRLARAPREMVALARGLRAPWLAMFGEFDRDTTPDIVAELRRTMANHAPVHTEVVTYPGASARFFDNASEGLEYVAYFDSRQRAIEWMNRRVVPRPTPLALQWQARKAHMAEQALSGSHHT